MQLHPVLILTEGRAVLQASAESSLINGQVLVADGGWTLVAGTLGTANPDKIWYE